MNTEERRAEFLCAAMELYQEKGYAKTSVRDISERVGVTRSLFYHYFEDKRAITDALIDSQIDDFMAYVRDWSANNGDKTMKESLAELSSIVRSRLHSQHSFGSLAIEDQDGPLFQRFTVRTANLLADYFVETRGQSGALIHITSTQHPRESFYILSLGIMSLMVRRPDVDDAVIADLIIDSLHIDT